MNLFKKESYPQLTFFAGFWWGLLFVAMVQGRYELTIILIACPALVLIALKVISMLIARKVGAP